jgi:hypothetical protein
LRSRQTIPPDASVRPWNLAGFWVYSGGNLVQRLFLAISAIVFLWGANLIVIPSAKAAGVNCSYDACIKECVHKGSTSNGCSKWCSDAMTERKNAGQCKK